LLVERWARVIAIATAGVALMAGREGLDGNRLDNCKCPKREEFEPSAVVAAQARSIKNSVILVTGAAVGGVAGLIYDRLAYTPGKI